MPTQKNFNRKNSRRRARVNCFLIRCLLLVATFFVFAILFQLFTIVSERNSGPKFDVGHIMEQAEGLMKLNYALKGRSPTSRAKIFEWQCWDECIFLPPIIQDQHTITITGSSFNDTDAVCRIFQIIDKDFCYMIMQHVVFGFLKSLGVDIKLEHDLRKTTTRTTQNLNNNSRMKNNTK